ncbi:MAG: hypothetical protein H6971_03890 [Gammaproteobacteria bacterium]|nr:hypothetical protein [Gammaproteobacteria bacterium]
MNEEKKKKYGIYAGPPLLRLIQERTHAQCSPTRVVNTVADRYQEIVQRSRPLLTLAEWAWIIAALHHRPTDDGAPALAGLWADIQDTLEETGESAVDVPTLVGKLRNLSYPETVAVVDVVERFRPYQSQPIPLQDALAALGVRIAPLSKAPHHGDPTWAMSPAELLQAIATLAGDNQSKFARICGVDSRTVRRWVSGKIAVPKLVQVLIRAWWLLPASERERLRQEAR